MEWKCGWLDLDLDITYKVLCELKMKSTLRFEVGQNIFNLILLLLTFNSSSSSSPFSSDEVTQNLEDALTSFSAGGRDTSTEPGSTEPPSSADEGLVVQTLRGKFRGQVMSVKNDGLVGAFKGVPYAEPPLRELRFRVNTKKYYMLFGSWIIIICYKYLYYKP